MPDIVLLDIATPNNAGLDLLCKIKTVLPIVLALIYTSTIDDALLWQSIIAGASGYLIKSLPPNKLKNGNCSGERLNP